MTDLDAEHEPTPPLCGEGEAWVYCLCFVAPAEYATRLPWRN